MIGDQLDSYFVKAGLPKPTIDEFFAGLEAAGFRFSLEGPGLFIGFPAAGTPEAAGASEALRRFPPGMFTTEEMVAFVRRRETSRKHRKGAGR